MLPQKLEVCYLAAIVAVGEAAPWWAAVAIVALALANNRSFWDWAAGIKDVAFKDWRITRRK
jgi:hypothetical protein